MRNGVGTYLAEGEDTIQADSDPENQPPGSVFIPGLGYVPQAAVPVQQPPPAVPPGVAGYTLDNAGEALTFDPGPGPASGPATLDDAGEAQTFSPGGQQPSTLDNNGEAATFGSVPPGVAAYGGPSNQIQPSPVPVAATPAPAPESRYLQSAKALEDAITGAPIKTVPKWWQSLAAAGAGFGAGWSNAGGRGRVPIDIGAMTDAVQHPGYAQQQAAYESRIAPLKAVAEIEGQKFAAQQEAAKTAATVNHLNKQADYYEAMRGTQVPVTQALAEASGGVLQVGSKVPATMAMEVMRVAAGKYDKTPRAAVTNDEKYAEAQRIYPASAGGTPEAWRQMVYNPTGVGKPDPQPHNLNPADVLLHPQDFPPNTVKTAQDLFDKEHRPPVNNFNIDSALTPDAIDQAARLYIETGHLDNYSSGPAGAQMRAKVMNRAAELGKDQDLAANRTEYAANQGATKDLEKNRARVLTSEGAASKNLNLAARVSGQVDRFGSPVMNKYLLYLKGQVGGDDNTQLLGNAVETAASEYANVVTAGLGGGAAATDAAREHARGMLNAAMGDGTFQKVVAQMKVEMQNRHSSFDQQLADLRAGRGQQNQPPGAGGPGRGGQGQQNQPPGAGGPGRGGPGRGGGQGGLVTVQIPGQPPGQIPAASLGAFKTKHPNAIVP